MSSLHKRQFSITESPEQGTSPRELSRNHLRDALGAYVSHARLEVTKTGRAILDKATDLHQALVEAMGEYSSTEWSEMSGFRSPGDVRKVKCGEHVATLTDLAVVAALDEKAFEGFAEAVARLAGGRFDPGTTRSAPIGNAIAGLAVSAADVASRYMVASADQKVTPAEISEIRDAVASMKKVTADVENSLAAAEGKK